MTEPDTDAPMDARTRLATTVDREDMVQHDNVFVVVCFVAGQASRMHQGHYNLLFCGATVDNANEQESIQNEIVD